MDSPQPQDINKIKTVLHNNTKSEVAAFIEQLELEMVAMQQGLHGIAMTARHEFIIQRMSEHIDEKKVDSLWQAMRQEQNEWLEHKTAYQFYVVYGQRPNTLFHC